MKPLHLLGISAAMSALLIFAAAEADAEPAGVGGGFRHVPPPSHGGHFNGFFPGFFVYDREVIHVIEREPAPRADPPPAAPAPLAPPREPYVIGKTYASLPGPCMKMIEDGASYYLCSGDWYRQVGSGSNTQYRAIARSRI
jgi:hypothetical protein